MIVILCDDATHAKYSFETFVDYLLHNESWTIRRILPFCNQIETTDDLRYVFVPEEQEVLFIGDEFVGGDDVLYADDFFEGLYEFELSYEGG